MTRGSASEVCPIKSGRVRPWTRGVRREVRPMECGRSPSDLLRVIRGRSNGSGETRATALPASRPLCGLCPCRTNAAVCGIMQQFAAEDGVVLGTIDWATAADSPTWAARPVRRAARKGASPTNTPSGKKLGVYKFGFRNKSEEKERDGRTTAPFFFLATPYQSNLYTSIFL